MVRSPIVISFSTEYEYELAKIRINSLKLNLKELTKKYFYVKDNYQIVGAVNEIKIKEDFEKMSLYDAKKIINYVEEELPQIKRKREFILKQFEPFKRAILEVLSDFVNLQDKRKETVFTCNYVLTKAFNKILAEKGIKDTEIIIQAALPEWILNKEKAELSTLSKKAYQGYLRIATEEIIGEEAQNKFDLMSKKENLDLKELKGYSACNGKSKGIVKVIKSVTEFSKLEKGEILVTSMTRPEFMPVLKLASAFITDEGGLTCHAAIISRELKKPCIIGTKIATQVLHDGDLVEVDAEKGVVKILKRKV